MYRRIYAKISPVFQSREYLDHPDAPCRAIIELAGGRYDRVAGWVDASQGRICRRTQLIPAVAVELPFAALERLAASSYVRRIWHDATVRTMLDVAVRTSGGALAQEQGITGKDMVAAVIDTGVAPHPDLTRPENRIIGWHDLVNSREEPYDDNGHGTHVAGIIAGNGTLSRGRFRGMAPEAKLVAVKALDANGMGRISDIIAAIEWCLEHQAEYGIRALNLSLGAPAEASYRFDPLCRAVAAAWNRGITVCAAAGNDGPEPGTINTPGIHPPIITVGNLDDQNSVALEDDRLAVSSSRGPTIDGQAKPDLLAPETGIISSKNRRGYYGLTGTSMATALVTGAVLQICEKWPTLQPDEIKKLLMDNARSLNLERNQQGAGAIGLAGIFQENEGDGKEAAVEQVWAGAASLAVLFMALSAFFI